MPTSSRCRATSWPTPRCRRPSRPAPATPTCASTRITTEVVQLRDGELETAVVDREVGLGGAGDRRRHVGLRLARRTAPRRRRRDGPPRGARWPRTLAPLNAETHRAGGRTGVRRRQLGVRLPRSTRSRSRPPTRSRCWPSTRAGCWPPTASTTSRRSLHAVKEQTFYADTFGSSITQQRVRVQPTLEAVTVDAAAGILRDDAHAGAADGAGLGGRRRRRRVGLVGRAGRAADRCSPRRSRRPA